MPYRQSERNPALQALIARHGFTKVARALDPSLTRQAVYEWPRVPEKWLAKASRVFRISKHHLRPDLYHVNGIRRAERITLTSP